MGRAAGAGSPLHTTSLPIPIFLCVPVSQLPARPQVRASDVVLPEGAVFVVANSLAVSNKAESATKHYNLRVVECRWALRQLGLWPALTWLSVCMQAISGLWLRASISCPVLLCCCVAGWRRACWRRCWARARCEAGLVGSAHQILAAIIA